MEAVAILLAVYMLVCAGGMFYAGYTHVSVSDAAAGFGGASTLFLPLLQYQSGGLWEFFVGCLIFFAMGTIFFGLGAGIGWVVGKLVGV